jgi:K+-transporting ATPase ATPase B chain
MTRAKHITPTKPSGPSGTVPPPTAGTRASHQRRLKAQPVFAGELVRAAIKQSFVLLSPFKMVRNPVMFVTELGAVLTTLVTLQEIFTGGRSIAFFTLITVVLWLTVLFANFAEALAEARGKAQAESLRATRQETRARKLVDGAEQMVSSNTLRPDDLVLVRAGEVIPGDGEVVEGVASVDEAAITGESAPVIREAGGDRSSVTGGTTVLSDQIRIRITAAPGSSFLDQMIALVEGAVRQKTPNEIAITLVLAGFTLAFLIVTAGLYPIGTYFDVKIDVPILVALLVCLIPTTIGALLSAIGIAGMDQAMEANLLAKSGKAIELAGDIDTLLLDKTGTITLGNRHATEFIPAQGVSLGELASAAHLASLADETPEGRSVVALAREQGIAAVSLKNMRNAEPVPFTAQTRMSGLNVDGRALRKGAADAVQRAVGRDLPSAVDAAVKRVSSSGGTPLVVTDNNRVLGVVHLKDIVKTGLRDRFIRLRAMGVRTVMITGDNALTAKTIAAEAGVDDFLAEATPEKKLELIKQEQAQGHLVAMAGDGTNDAPALAQADVAVAMNAGTPAAKEAANMVDLDSNPTKMIEVIEIGKRLLMTRGALTTFSIANDIAKYFAIIPAIFMIAMPHLAPLNIMGLATPTSAILSATIFNAIIIPLLIPIALRGVRYRPIGADALLARNIVFYGVGGVIAPFIGIKLIDMVLAALHVA